MHFFSNVCRTKIHDIENPTSLLSNCTEGLLYRAKINGKMESIFTHSDGKQVSENSGISSKWFFNFSHNIAFVAGNYNDSSILIHVKNEETNEEEIWDLPTPCNSIYSFQPCEGTGPLPR